MIDGHDAGGGQGRTPHGRRLSHRRRTAPAPTRALVLGGDTHVSDKVLSVLPSSSTARQRYCCRPDSFEIQFRLSSQRCGSLSSRLLKNTRIGLFSWPSCVSRPPPTTVRTGTRCPDAGASDTRGRRSGTPRLQIPQPDQISYRPLRGRYEEGPSKGPSISQVPASPVSSRLLPGSGCNRG